MTMHEVIEASSSADEGREELQPVTEQERIKNLRENLGNLVGSEIQAGDGQYYREVPLGLTRDGEKRSLRVDYGRSPRSDGNLPRSAMIRTLSHYITAEFSLDFNEETDERSRATRVVTRHDGEGTAPWRDERYAQPGDIKVIEHALAKLKQQEAVEQQAA